MKYLYLVIAILLSQTVFSQFVQHKLTEADKVLMPTYLKSISSTGFINPPSSPVRAAAEWEEMDGVAISWKSYTSVLTEIVREIKNDCDVYIVCEDSNSVKTTLTNAGVSLTNLYYLEKDFGSYYASSVWIRDFGPNNVYTNDVDSLLLVDWIYNRPRPADDTVSAVIANRFNIPLYETTQAPYELTHTGGNFMSDGFGTGFSSNLVLDENTSLTSTQVDDIMEDFMGINRYIKMSTLPYDGIHHIDMHLKLLDEETLLVGEYPAGTADGPQIETNLQYVLNNFNSVYGTPYKVVRIPMPPDGSYYPNNGGDYLTYTNSLIINKTVIVPQYYEEYDTVALRIYREAMPGYNVVGINSNQTIGASGSLHCITHEIGAKDPLLISHQELDDTNDNINDYQVDARILHRSGIQTATLYYRTNSSSAFTSVNMTLTDVLTNTWTGYIPTQANSVFVDYYIEANAVSGKQQVRPMPAPAGFWTFHVDGLIDIFDNILLSDIYSFDKTLFVKVAKSESESDVKISVYNTFGQKVTEVYNGKISNLYDKKSFNLAELSTGIYIVSVQTQEKTLNKKIQIK